MTVILNVKWELSTEHSACTYGQPLLVNRDSGDAYGPSDIVQVYEHLGPMVAARAGRALALTAELDTAGKALVELFVKGTPPQ